MCWTNCGEIADEGVIFVICLFVCLYFLKETIKQKPGPNSTQKEVLEKSQQIIRTVYEELHQIYRKRCKELWKRKQ
jgi:hypothetical protein